MKKDDFKKPIFMVWIIVFISIALFYTLIYIGNKVDDFRYEVLSNLRDDVTNVQCIPYAYLNEKYKYVVSEKEYTEAASPKEIIRILELFNEIRYEVKSTTSLTTDGFETEPRGTVEVDGQKYDILHHIGFKTRNGKPLVVKWYADIEKQK